MTDAESNAMTDKEQATLGFGLCPHCLNHDGYVNIGDGHWFYCTEHRTIWCAGFNLLSSWRDQTEQEQRAIHEALGLDGYQIIEPVNVPSTH
jgi:hypothetical protein